VKTLVKYNPFFSLLNVYEGSNNSTFVANGVYNHTIILSCIQPIILFLLQQTCSKLATDKPVSVLGKTCLFNAIT